MAQGSLADDVRLDAPFPWFGGKSRVAPLAWSRFGDCRNYVEPFAGSLAVLLGRPRPFAGVETVNDLDGYICNFWRALRADPEAVAHWADQPVNENDLHARHAWLVARKADFVPRLEGDPDFYCAKTAGWWCWGLCCWIGSGWCSGKGPWAAADMPDGSRQLVHLGDAGQGVNRQRVHLGNAGQGVNRQRAHLGDAGRGVNRKRVHLGNSGQGVNRQRVHLGDAGRGVNRPSAGLAAWMQAMAGRLRGVRVCCGDWTRVCGGRSGDSMTVLTTHGKPTAVFLDPPYADTAGRDPRLYVHDDLRVAHAVREWAIRHGDTPGLRIALCGYEGEHAMPDGWECVPWKARGGYGSQADAAGRANAGRERVWFSPQCLRPNAVAAGSDGTLFCGVKP